MVSKKQIANGVAKFVNNDLIPDITDDEKLKFVLNVAKKSMRENPSMLDSFLENPMIASVMKKDGDMYDVESFATAMRNTLAETESYPITVPKVPLIMSEGRIIKITAQDVDKLWNYIIGEQKPE